MIIIAPVDRYRQLRGLVYHYRRRITTSSRYRRSLIDNQTVLRDPQHGTCKWCRLPCERRRQWHTHCVKAYRAACGLQRQIGGRPLIRKAPCELCGADGAEIDHRIALSVAWATGDRKTILWAWAIDNLRWLCRKCHSGKTSSDMRKLADGQGEQHNPNQLSWLNCNGTTDSTYAARFGSTSREAA